MSVFLFAAAIAPGNPVVNVPIPGDAAGATIVACGPAIDVANSLFINETVRDDIIRLANYYGARGPNAAPKNNPGDDLNEIKDTGSTHQIFPFHGTITRPLAFGCNSHLQVLNFLRERTGTGREIEISCSS